MSLFSRVLLLTGLCSSPLAQGALTINGNGTVTDTATGLMWDQCAYGLTGAACASGSAIQGNWGTALQQASSANSASYKGYSDWRLPNKNELESIADRTAYNPSINASTFPGTPAGWFWTATTHGPDPGYAWYVSFDFGGPGLGTKPTSYYVRLVRSGQPLAAYDSLQPPASGTCGSAHSALPLLASAPSSNLCGTGSMPSGVTSNPSAYSWTCTDSGGGPAALCSAGRGYTVVLNPGANGSITFSNPTPAQPVAYHSTPSFAVVPNSGFGITSITGCGGTLVGSTYTAAAVTGDCTISASFGPAGSSPTAIPTLNEWAMALLTGLLGALTWRATRRKSA